MRRTQPEEGEKTVDELVEILEPKIVNALVEAEVGFSTLNAARLVRALGSIAVRLFLCAGGDQKRAMHQLVRAHRIGKKEAAECQFFALTTQPLAKA